MNGRTRAHLAPFEGGSYRMAPAAKAAWLKALRSGHYKQGQTYLRSIENEFCCLGVLCDLGTSKNWVYAPYNHYFSFYENHGLLPNIVAERARLPRDLQYALAAANDDGATFEEIADWIEANL